MLLFFIFTSFFFQFKLCVVVGSCPKNVTARIMLGEFRGLHQDRMILSSHTRKVINSMIGRHGSRDGKIGTKGSKADWKFGNETLSR